MEYKYFIQKDECYELKMPMKLIFLSMIILGTMAILGVYETLTTDENYLLFSLFFLVLLAVLFYRNRTNKLIFQPHSKKILIKKWGKTETFQYTDFINFKITHIYIQRIIPFQKHVTLFLNDNGKKKAVTLGMAYRTKKADELIAETRQLLS